MERINRSLAAFRQSVSRIFGRPSSGLVGYTCAAVLLVFLLYSAHGAAQGTHQAAGYEANRARLLAYILRSNLESSHFSHKKLDDKTSEDAFGLYLKQLDYQKRILMFDDVQKLRVYSKKIDDEMTSGDLELPVKAWAIYSVRAEEAQKIVKEILAEDFDFSAKEFIESDVEKIDYCKDEKELRERWRKILKYEVLIQYLGLAEDTDSPESTAPKSEESAQKKKPDEKELRKSARDKVMKNYEHYFSRISREKEAEHYERFFSAVTRAFDPHTDYMPPSDKEDFDIGMRGSLEGIGATLKEDEGQIKVVSIIAGSPASRQQQLQAEDVVLKVGEGDAEPVPVVGMRVKYAVKLIRGKKGTEVRLTIRKPNDKVLIIPIIRDIIQIEDSFVKNTVIKGSDAGDAIGYIRIPSFYRDFEGTSDGHKGRNVTDDVIAALNEVKAQKIGGLIIDLRNNGGGALTDAVKIAGLFIETGPVVQVKSSNDRINTMSDDQPEILYDGPLIILVNTTSASASEILAGALQNYGRAVVMGGEHTHGKGTVQTIRDLNNNVPFKNMETYKPLGAIKLTIQKFYRINGSSTQYRGVVPDIILPDVMTGLKTGEQYLDYALPWDTVQPVPYTPWKKCRPDMTNLKEKSRQRVSTNQQFIDMEKQAQRLAEKKKNTLRSLNVDDMRRENEESKKDKDIGTAHGKIKEGKEAKSAEAKKEELLKTVSEDDYVKEAIAVIKDMTAADPSCISAARK